MQLYRKFDDVLKFLQDKKSDDANKPLIDSEQLAEAYQALKDFAASFDYDNAQFVLQSLEEYKLPEDEKVRYEKIKSALENLNWEQVNELL